MSEIQVTNYPFQPLSFEENITVYSVRYYLLYKANDTSDGLKSYVTFFTGSVEQIRQQEKVYQENPAILRVSREIVSIYDVREFGHVSFIKNNFKEDKKE